MTDSQAPCPVIAMPKKTPAGLRAAVIRLNPEALKAFDDEWASVGSANLNRRSWTYDSELTAAVVDEHRDSANAFAQELRLRLWREHLGRSSGEDADLTDPEKGAGVLRSAAAELDDWHRDGRAEPRPVGHLRRHPRRSVSTTTRLWAVPLGRTTIDPDGRPLWDRR